MGKETQILSRKKALANQPYFQGVLAGLGQGIHDFTIIRLF